MFSISRYSDGAFVQRVVRQDLILHPLWCYQKKSLSVRTRFSFGRLLANKSLECFTRTSSILIDLHEGAVLQSPSAGSTDAQLAEEGTRDL